MKKILAVLLVCVMAMAVLTGCGGKDEPSGSGNTQVEQDAPENKVVAEEVGKWIISGGSYLDVAFTEEDIAGMGDAYIEFTEDGKGVLNVGEKTDFTWKDKTITVEYEGEKESTTYEIKDGVLALTLDEETIVTFTKE